MTISQIIARTLPLALFFVAGTAFAQDGTNPQDYLLVKDLPFVKDVTSLSGYLSAIFKLGIGIAVTAAIFMIVLGGIRYMFSDVPGIKFNAKADITNALWGLVLVLASWLILNTINPQLVEFRFIQTLEDAANGVVAPTTPNNTPTGSCENCAPLPRTNPPIPITASCGSSCELNVGLIGKIESLNRTLVERKIGWRITEAYPPLDVHRKGSCHDTGSCFDANVQSATDVNIVVFQDAASSVGLRAVYEVKSNDEAVRLRSVGVNPVLFNPGASAPHFHVTQ